MEPLQQGDPPQIGPYRLVGRLGKGGMGQVFLGLSRGGWYVALKVIHPEMADNRGFRERFAREVAAARRVNAFYTAPVADADPNGKIPWLATMYVPGPSLQDAVLSYGPMPVAFVRSLGAALAEGLGAIHAADVVHCDLKPSNVLLAHDGPRIIDFGISRAVEATTLTSSGVIGTPAFMSPEQANKHHSGPPSDVFSLGSVLTFAATNNPPFLADTPAGMMYQIAYAQPSLDYLPAELRPVIEHCLAKDPGQRPTPDQIITALGPARPRDNWLPEPIARTLPSYLPPTTPYTQQYNPPQSETYETTTLMGKASGPKPSGPARRGLKISVAVTIAITLTVALHLTIGIPPLPWFSSSTPSHSANSSGSASSSLRHLNYKQLVALLPPKDRGSCHSEGLSVNGEAGETAIAACKIKGYKVEYTAYMTEQEARGNLSALGHDFTGPGNCAPQLNGSTPKFIEGSYSFDRGALQGLQYCDYEGGFFGPSTMGWIDKRLPLVLGEMADSRRLNYNQVYSRWRAVIAAE